MMPGKVMLQNPDRRFLFELAERLGRTVGELMYGSASHRPISSREVTEWQALWRLRAWEAEQARKKAR
jgi:hypothetical protein